MGDTPTAPGEVAASLLGQLLSCMSYLRQVHAQEQHATACTHNVGTPSQHNMHCHCCCTPCMGQQGAHQLSLSPQQLYRAWMRMQEGVAAVAAGSPHSKQSMDTPFPCHATHSTTQPLHPTLHCNAIHTRPEAVGIHGKSLHMLAGAVQAATRLVPTKPQQRLSRPAHLHMHQCCKCSCSCTAMSHMPARLCAYAPDAGSAM